MDVKEAAVEYLPEAVPQTPEDDVPPGYKRTEVGVIPEDWSVTPLGDVAIKVGSGKTPTGGSLRYKSHGRPFIRSQNVGWGELLLDDLVYIDDATHSEFLGTELHLGDVLLNITGASIGRSAVADGRLVGGNVNQHVCIIRIDQDNGDPRFANALLLSMVGQDQIDSFQAGGNRQGLNFHQVRSISFPLPPATTEQRAIATALSDADALIDALQRLIAKKRAIKQGTMQALLTGRQRLPGFTGEWETKPMEELFTFSGGVSASREQLGSTGYCYLHYGDIHTSAKTVVSVQADSADIPKLDVPLNKVSRGSLLNDGDVVFVDASEDEDGASKHVVVVNPDAEPFISGLHTIVAKAKNDTLVPAYCRYCFQTRHVKGQFRFFAVGTKVLGVSKGNIGKIEVLVPRCDEQTAIATVLADMDAEIEALEARLAKTRALKSGMMQQLLTGRIRMPLEEAA